MMGQDWLPTGKTAAICFSIDDIHPGTSKDAYEAGGDLGEGALGHILWLFKRHPQFRATLFTTADWREIRAFPAHPSLHRIPGLAKVLYRTGTHPKGRMALDRHPAFVEFLRSEPNFEVGLHGLHHVHPTHISPVEFQEQDRVQCRAMLAEALQIFERAGLTPASGMTPPGWNAPPALLDAMTDLGLEFVASARDIFTPVDIAAKANMSGLKGVDLYRPQFVHGDRLVHIPSNFQATSPIERAFEIIEAGGLLSIKGHIVKNCFGHIALDGIDSLYRNYLDTICTALEDRYGDKIWWTSMGEIATRFRAAHGRSGDERPGEALPAPRPATGALA